MNDASTNRLPLPTKDRMTAEQRLAAEKISAGPRGAVIGPFAPLLRAPELMTRVQLVGEYLRFDSQLDDYLFEMAILCVARHWDQQFEWGFHQPIARSVGLPDYVIRAIDEGDERPAAARDITAAWDVVDQLLTTGQVTDEAFAEALDVLGDQKLVELITTVGYYTTLALVMNAAQTPSPADAPRLSERVPSAR